MNKHLTDLQSRLAFQEDSIDELNRTIARQAQEIKELQHGFREIAKRLQTLSSSDTASEAEEAPPPHY
ncbi:hypothetical protein MNBD_GAMMA26-110 [hydrothermal vent metagenome]|uniref:Protein SlyX homolog n=1 Tax=hydrothermal vent metagenome TaxID=652676 RepID=A0A3B1AWU8_9ZZZZ